MSQTRGGAIVLVEDDPADVRFVELAFERARITNPLRTFDRVERAKEYTAQAITRTLPALFIVDLRLEATESGFEFLRWLREQPGPVGQTPALVLTGSERQEDRDQSRAFGALAFLQKPVTETTLVAAVQSLGFVVVTNLVSGDVGFRILERAADTRVES
jgi:CheY-like chemotaxis protein